MATATQAMHGTVAGRYPDDDAFLVEASRQGDTQAFDTLARRYQERIFRVACRITRDPSVAEDVRQSSLLNAFQRLHQFEGRSKFSTWVLRIAINTSLMSLRRRTHREVSIDDDRGADGESVAHEFPTGSPNPEQICLRSELRTTLNAAVDRLSPRLKAVFLLHSVEGLSGREIASELGVTEVAVKVRLHRARARLKSMLGPLLGHQPRAWRL